MTELFPPNDELENLSGLTEPRTGVYYPVKGEGLDWYVSFVKCIYRLVKNVSVASGLRVFKTGPLTCGVKRGMFFDGAAVRDYAGTEGLILADNVTNYLYLTAAGTLEMSMGGFPDPATVRHLRLAVITTHDGGFTDDDITEYRHGHLFSPAGPVAHLAPAAVGPVHLAAGLAEAVPNIQITVGTEANDAIAITIQVRNARGEAVAGRFLLHAWLADSPHAGETPTAPSGTTSFTEGTLLVEPAAKKRWQALTAATGRAVLTVGETGTRTWYLNVELNGRVYAGPAITFNE